MCIKDKEGFVSFLVLLLSIGIIIVLIVRIYFTKEGKGMRTETQDLLPVQSDEAVPQTRYDQLQSAKRAAEGIQDTLDIKGGETKNALKE